MKSFYRKKNEEKNSDNTILLHENVDCGDEERFYSQQYLKENVNLYTADKSFNISLKADGSSYFSKYSLDGNNLLCFSKNGYLASINQVALKANFELENEIDKIYDATYLHNEQYVAVSQTDALFIYDNQGVELICHREFSKYSKLEFLPLHFLLACVKQTGVKYLDTSTGKIVSRLAVKNNGISTVHEGVIYLTHPNGVVTLHAPLQKDYLLKLKASSAGITDIKAGLYNKRLYVSTNNNQLNVFDIRNTLKPLEQIRYNYKVNGIIPRLYNLSLSSNGSVALYSDKDITVLNNNLKKVYFEKVPGHINSCNFSPFDDICAVSTDEALRTLIFPGIADVNFDSRENSPFLTKNQKREKEVRMLLQKIPPQMISYNSEIFNKNN